MPYFFDNVDKASIAAGPHAEQLTAPRAALSLLSPTAATLTMTNCPSGRRTPGGSLDYAFRHPSSVENDPNGAERLCWDGVSLGGL